MVFVVKGICKLCSKEAHLQESHIIPKFAVKWMKQTGTNYIRRISAPNKREQDGVKQRLLCSECEQRFSTAESYFATQIFRPFLAHKQSVHYDGRLTYFVVSLLWRTLQRERNAALAATCAHNAHFSFAELEWQSFLLGKGRLTNFNHLHIFITDLSSSNDRLIENFNLYSTRATDATFFELKGRCYIVAKFSRFIFVGILSSYATTDWVGTRILNGRGTLSVPQEIHDLAFGGWLAARAQFAYKKFNSEISGNQRRVIEAHIREKLPDFSKSDLFNVAMADHLQEQKFASRPKTLSRNRPCSCGSGVRSKNCCGV
jgi:hypothetical protein